MSWSTASRPDGLEQPVVGTSAATDSPEPALPPVPHPEPARDTDDPAVMREAWRVLSVVGLASMFSGMSNSALNVALPAVAREYDASATASSWILLSFMLTQTLLMVSFGRLADLFGRRSMYLTGLAVFTVGNLLAGFAPDAWWLVACRVLQAAGAAMLLTNSAALVTGAFPRHRLGQGMGIYLASFSVAQLVGPTLGGFLAEHVGVEWLFWSNVPVGIGCLVWGIVALPPVPRSGERLALDVPGNLLAFLGLGCGLVALSQVTSLGWSHPVVVGGLLAFAVLLPAFLLVEGRVRDPLMDTRLFEDRSFSWGLSASFLNAISNFGVVLLVSLYLQAVGGEDALSAGLKVLPLAVSALIFSAASGFFQRWVEAHTLTVLGNAATAAGLGVLLLLGSEVNDAAVLIGLVLTGAGSGFFMPSNTQVLLATMPSERLGIANGMRLMLQNTGAVLGTAVILTVLTSPLPRELRRYVFSGTISEVSDAGLADLLTGYRWTAVTLLLVCLGAIVCSLGARRAVRRA
ncbi:MFS transporter [Blastococcus sp. TF02-09]|uniref:MFS transporter n=1 Tax=Blastococcus sp. TF02-09 TaxID=2250576 RepID=UPI000DEA3465|nr:MFS transporter [Blastococcus sp. TF02-9]RBY81093.1 MFS transporter [Blastococcus sp. TF02-9]